MDSPLGSKGSGSDSSRATSAVAEHASSRGSSVTGPNVGRSEPQMQNLADRLAAAEKHLQERSRHEGTSVSSYDSEERDNALLAQQVEEELEKKSSIASVDSEENIPVEGQPTAADMFAMKLRSGSTSKRQEVSKSASASGPSKSGSSSSHSAAHLRNIQPVQHNTREEPGSSSSGSANNSTIQQATMDLWQQLLDSQDAKAKADRGMLDVKSTMNELRMQHKMEMEEMAKRLKLQEREEAKAVANSEVMQQQIENLQTKHYKAKLEVNHKALQVFKARAKEEEDKGDLRDELAGAEARHKARVEHLEAELRAAKESKKEEEAKVREKMQETKKKALEEQAALKKEVISTRTKVKNIADERDVLKRNLRSVQDTLKPQVDTLKEQLDVAHSEIRSTLELPKNPEDAPEGTVVKEKAKVLSLKEQLANSKVQQKEIVDELSEMRMKMLGMQKEHNEEVGDLQMLVAKASATLELTSEGHEVKIPASVAPQILGNQIVLPVAGRGLSLGRGVLAGRGRGLNAKSRRKGLMNKLTAIEEDEGSFDGSIACSGNVSSDGAEGVGDLGDFDEFTELPEELPPLVVVDKKVVFQKQALEQKVQSLQEELEQDRAMKEKLKEEVIGKDAMHASKVDRLVSRLQDTKREKLMTEEALQEIRMRVSLEEEGEVERLRLKLEEEKNEKWLKTEELADMKNFLAKEHESQGDVVALKQRLFVAMEAKRISDARAEDFKGAVEQMERQHEAIVAELRHQLQVAEGAQQAGGDTSSLVVAEVEELRQQIRGLIEERNVLTNTLEWKEVQWQNKFETMELQQAAELADLKRCKEASLKEKSKLEAENDELRSQVELLQKEKQQLEAATKAQPSPPPQSLAPAWLQRLRCPVREVASGPPPSPGEAAHCQDICWRILNTMQGVTALLCSVRDFVILEASKTACMTWGSSALHGQSVLTLVNGPSRAAWLRRAFQLHQDVAEGSTTKPGFVVRDIGCEEFTNKSGHVFDSTVITAHLPAEPRCGKTAAWLVIIEPQGGSNANPSAVPGPSSSSRVEARRGNQRSSQSEVSSVNPSDSASNIFDRGGLFQQRGQ